MVECVSVFVEMESFVHILLEGEKSSGGSENEQVEVKVIIMDILMNDDNY